MATVSDIVGRALRILRVINPLQPIQAIDMETGMTALNAMVRRWEANTLALGWSDVTDPEATAPLPEEAIEAVVYNLALKLRPEYGAELEPDVVEMARQGLADLQRDQIIATPLERDRRSGHYNIYTDDFA